MPKILMPIPCHFKSSAELCDTTIARMRVALKIKKFCDIILLSGDVPFIPDGPTLGSLMHDWFAQNGIDISLLNIVYGGVGTFSEARIACQMVSHLKVREIVLISSDWYLFAGKPIWNGRAKENDIHISYISIRDTGGLRTRLVYGFIGTVVRAGIFFGLERQLERFFTSAQKGRLKGFTLNGCA